MTDTYVLLTVLAILVILALVGLWAYRGFFEKAALPPQPVPPEVPVPPPELRAEAADLEAQDRERRARIARLSSIGNDNRRF